jgi:hypothetical protein
MLMIRTSLEDLEDFRSSSGKFTEASDEPLLMNLTSAVETSVPIDDWASSVLPPI